MTWSWEAWLAAGGRRRLWTLVRVCDVTYFFFMILAVVTTHHDDFLYVCVCACVCIYSAHTGGGYGELLAEIISANPFIKR